MEKSKSLIHDLKIEYNYNIGGLSMKVIAGLDIMHNKCVHLIRGDVESTMQRDEHPLEIFRKLDKCDIDAFQITDIDGVFSGQTNMFDLLKDIRKTTDKPILFGGGIRDFQTAERVIETGIDQIILGTSAVKNQDLLIDLLEKYPNQIAVAADVYKDFVYVDGWEENSSITIQEFLNTLSLIHVPTIIITDISLDGTKSGVNVDFVTKLTNMSHEEVIVSGGIKKSDLDNLKDLSIGGVVIGTDIYEALI